MLKTKGEIWIGQLRTKWISLYVLQFLTFSIGISILLGTILVSIFSISYWILAPIFIATLVFFVLIRPFWKISVTDLSSYLNAEFPILEESTHLFLKPANELTLLEKLQVYKIEPLFPLKGSLKPRYQKLGFALLVFILGIGISYIIHETTPFNWSKQSNNQHSAPVIKEQIPVQITVYQVTITSPAYTNIGPRTQEQLSIKVAVGAKISWKITTDLTVKTLKMIFNDQETIQLKAINGKWAYSKTINQSGFYQLEIDGKKSDLYQIEVIPDLPVKIKIVSPKPRTTIDVGQAQKINLSYTLTDDYGIAAAFISATMASGKGEGVSFTAKKIPLNSTFNNQTTIKGNQLIDLKSLGMKPGDELYFFIKATDNKGQQSQSDVYLVDIVDTTELMSMAGMTSGVNLVPEYFRSQRQIIIDTEKLLKEQSTITADEFKNRSNTLGIDQKLLRLRYGQFLGEESETEIGGDNEHKPDDGHDHGKVKTEEKFGDAQAIMDQYSHKHDIAEDATFFEPEMKAQLKAVLTEMWSSELRLRTYKPQDALPFEYKALRLLKDLQQKSRAYVAKTTIKVSKLKLEKRLSGELDKITESNTQSNVGQKDKAKTELKLVLSMLDDRKSGKFNGNEQQLLMDAEKQLIIAAAGQPNAYLSALKGLRKMTVDNKPINPKDITTVQQAIQKIIGAELIKPQSSKSNAALGLSQKYFNHLKNADK